jgi:hypothetical protein
VLAQRNVTRTATDGDLPITVKTLEFTGNGFDFLAAPPLLGRTFTAQEAPQGVAPPAEAVISYLFWKSRFASASDVVGKGLELNHQKYTVIGVTGPRFTWTDAEVYLPLSAGIDPQRRLSTLIRMNPGVTLRSAAGEMDAFVRQIVHDHPEVFPRDSFEVKVETLNDSLLGQLKGTL